MKKFLIIKTSSLGDIIQSFPVVEYLKKQSDSVKIDWIVESAAKELIESHPCVDRVITIQTKKWRTSLKNREYFKEVLAFKRSLQEESYDAIFDLQGNMKSALLTFLAGGKDKVGFGLKSVHEWPNALFTSTHFNPPKEVNIREDYLSIVQQYFNDKNLFNAEYPLLKINEAEKEQLNHLIQPLKGEIILVFPGSAWKNKQMTPNALYEFLVKIENSRLCSFLLAWGTKEEKELVDALKSHLGNSALVIDRLTLPLLQNLMAQVHLVIAMDSLPLHLAGTTATPTFSVFGASLAKKFKPIGHQHAALQGACPYGRTFEKRCPVLRTCPTGQCIRGLSGDFVFEKFKEKFG